jgi:gamma-glutamyltranspeptidase/glutathione hydrolase
MVASSHPGRAAGWMLRGGNAVDAAVAVNAMLGVVEPMSCGIGGDLFVICGTQSQKLYGLNGGSGSTQTRDRRVSPTGTQTNSDHRTTVLVRAGLRARVGRFARPFRHAQTRRRPRAGHRGGRRWVCRERIIGGYWKGAEKSLTQWPDSAATYLSDGKAPAAGTIARLPRLAATYRQIASGGAKEFYEGSIAERIVKFSEANGGFFAAADFADHKSEWLDPVSTNYRGYDVWELPPNGQGIAALQILNILNPTTSKNSATAAPLHSPVHRGQETRLRRSM